MLLFKSKTTSQINNSECKNKGGQDDIYSNKKWSAKGVKVHKDVHIIKCGIKICSKNI